MSNIKPNFLFLADTTHHTAAVIDHINAITSSDVFNWHILNPLLLKTIDKCDLTAFDGIGIHYSIKPYNNYYLSASLQKKLADYTGIKFLFLQDEYQRVNQVQEFLHYINFDILFTLVNEKFLKTAYPDPRLQQLKKISVLTGYVTDEMQTCMAPPIRNRTIDVSYRGRRCDFWLGSLAYGKQYIAEEFVKRTAHAPLNLDISIEESDRMYGPAWSRLLKNSKAVLGTESGASIWDFDRSAEKNTKAYLRRNKNADFPEVLEQVLQPYEGRILYNAASPRIFEAAATRTAMIMFPGEYSNVCRPDVHYLVLQQDFSNIEEILSKLNNHELLQEMVDRTYQDLIVEGRYSQQQFSDLISAELMKLITHKSRPESNNCIKENIETINQDYRQLNFFRRSVTELFFIGSNFFGLLFDARYGISTRLVMMSKAWKRYLVYLLPRLGKRRG